MFPISLLLTLTLQDYFQSDLLLNYPLYSMWPCPYLVIQSGPPCLSPLPFCLCRLSQGHFFLELFLYHYFLGIYLDLIFPLFQIFLTWLNLYFWYLFSYQTQHSFLHLWKVL